MLYGECKEDLCPLHSTPNLEQEKIDGVTVRGMWSEQPLVLEISHERFQDLRVDSSIFSFESDFSTETVW